MTSLQRSVLCLGVTVVLAACGGEDDSTISAMTGGTSGATATTADGGTTGATATTGAMDTSGTSGATSGTTGFGTSTGTTGFGATTTGTTGDTSGSTTGTTGDTTGTTGDTSGNTTGSTGDTTGDNTAADPSMMGPYEVQSTADGLRDGPDYGSQTLHYPTAGDGPFPIATVVPGWMSVEAQIQEWGPFLASHGIVTLTIGTNSISETPPQRAAALLDALETLEAENTRSGGPVEGRLDTSKSAVLGWSMGGGGALLAADEDDSIDAVVSLAGWNPGHDYGGISQPALLMAAAADTLAGGQSQGFYTTIPDSVPKMLWETTNLTAFFGGHDTFNSPKSLEGEVGRYGLAWLKVHMEGDDSFLDVLTEGAPSSDHTAFCTNLEGADAEPGGSAAVGCP